MTSAPLFAGIGGHHSHNSRTDEWLTPPSIIEALGGASSFDLDPCSPVGRPWDTARQHYTVIDNGLIQQWHGRVWLNPPYSSTELGKWMGRMAEHGVGTALIFARTETGAFFRYVWESASALLFMRGRINFHYVNGARATANSGAPSVLCAYGRSDADILACCSIAGNFVPLRLPRAIVAMAIPEKWSDVVWQVLSKADGAVALQDIYRAIASHPKARGRQHYTAKIRQILQQGPFRRVGRGQWAVA